ncbi:MAG: MBL fold metallo-hydrolase [Planctomycetes bacterium]|nr:MBL fold metallo-hydrolase [Planctomycetota bacterium]
MELTIHRGTHEIGGSCVELRAQGQSLLLDIGMPLSEPNGTRFDEAQLESKATEALLAQRILPNVPGLYGHGASSAVGVILTHSHLDHYGLGRFVRADVPVHATPGTIALIRVTERMLKRSGAIRHLVPLAANWQPRSIGPFLVRAHPVDHSAPDAIAVEVQADDRKVLYSGDLRGHGRKKALFEHLVARPPCNVDVLLMEGSTLDRGAPEYATEAAVECAVLSYLEGQGNLAMLFCSAQNLDRIVTAFRVARRTGRTLVVDLYGAFVLHVLAPLSRNIPQFSWDGVRVKFWHNQQKALEENGHGDFVRSVMRSGHGIRTPEIVERRAGILMLGRSNSIFGRFIAKFPVEGLKMVWSMWSGYLRDDKYLKPFCERHGIQLKEIHTSGHATPADLARLVGAIRPRLLIPIHTMRPEAYTRFSAPLRLLRDGETLAL